MVTGDNILTGLSVARECGIIRPDKKVLKNFLSILYPSIIQTFILEHKKDEKNIEGRTRLTIKQVFSLSFDPYDHLIVVGVFVGRHHRRSFLPH